MLAVQRHAWALLARANLRPPLSDADLEKLAKLQGARIVKSAGLGSLHGALSTTHEGMVIRVNPALTGWERRYAIAHEIGHTLIDGDVPFLRRQLAVTMDPPLRLSSSEREKLCDHIAAELLAAQPALLASLHHRSHTTGLIRDLTDEYQIPESGIIIQMAAADRLQLEFSWRKEAL